MSFPVYAAYDEVDKVEGKGGTTLIGLFSEPDTPVNIVLDSKYYRDMGGRPTVNIYEIMVSEKFDSTKAFDGAKRTAIWGSRKNIQTGGFDHGWYDYRELKDPEFVEYLRLKEKFEK